MFMETDRSGFAVGKGVAGVRGGGPVMERWSRWSFVATYLGVVGKVVDELVRRRKEEDFGFLLISFEKVGVKDGG